VRLINTLKAGMERIEQSHFPFFFINYKSGSDVIVASGSEDGDSHKFC